ncbi:hypothetical protein MW887_006033 [Aspergillus wentii]|nr:hypothetical protein MW887_006033 [Aspergillus wentii]
MSIALSKNNIPHILFEKHESTSIHPKALGLNQRTVEYLRSLGLEEEIRKAAAPPESVSQTAWYTSLGPEGKEILSRDAWGGGQYAEEYARASPCRYTMLPQIRLEPILHRQAKLLNPSGIVNNARVVRVEEKPDYVVLYVERDNDPGVLRTYQARYVVAADGGRMVADALGIKAHGDRDFVDMVSAYIQAPISEHHPNPHALITWFVDPKMGGSINTGFLYHLGPYQTEEAEEWMFACALSPSESRKFDEKAMIERLHRTLKIPGLKVEIKSISHWQVTAIVAERFRSQGGRIFLVGDAAHRIPPWGALGLNTGIQDVQNLVWKLSMVIKKRYSDKDAAYDKLLDTYEKERQPIAQQVARTSLTNLRSHGLAMDRALGILPDARPEDNDKSLKAFLDKTNPQGDHLRDAVVKAQAVLDSEFHAPGAEVGWFYPSLDVKDEGAESRHGGQLKENGAFDVVNYHPSAIPGHHLPHVWLRQWSEAFSTRDLLMRERFLLLAAANETWATVESSLVSVAIVRTMVNLWDDAIIEEWKKLNGVGEDGAVLVRPDGIVLYRFQDFQPITTEFITDLLGIAPVTVKHNL